MFLNFYIQKKLQSLISLSLRSLWLQGRLPVLLPFLSSLFFQQNYKSQSQLRLCVVPNKLNYIFFWLLKYDLKRKWVILPFFANLVILGIEMKKSTKTAFDLLENIIVRYWIGIDLLIHSGCDGMVELRNYHKFPRSIFDPLWILYENQL